MHEGAGALGGSDIRFLWNWSYRQLVVSCPAWVPGPEPGPLFTLSAEPSL